jgi:hypothetical protein
MYGSNIYEKNYLVTFFYIIVNIEGKMVVQLEQRQL